MSYVTSRTVRTTRKYYPADPATPNRAGRRIARTKSTAKSLGTKKTKTPAGN